MRTCGARNPVCTLLALLVLLCTASAQEPATTPELQPDSGELASSARLVAELPADAAPWVGQRLDLRVKLLVEGRFTGSPRFDLPQLPEAVFVRVGGSNSRALLGSERLEGRDIVSATYRFAVFALRAGTLHIPAFEVRFSSKASFDAPVRTHTLNTTPLQLEVRARPGLDPAPNVPSSRSLEFEERWSDEPEELRVGDALHRTLNLHAEDTPGMLLPEPRFVEVEGLRLYAEAPRLDTDMQRGAFRGERTDVATYVCTTEGEWTLPAIELRWWDSERAELRTESVSERVFVVKPGPTSAPLADGTDAALKPRDSVDSEHLTLLALGAALLGGALWWVAPRLRTARSRLEQQHAQSEAGRFQALQQSLRGGDAATSLGALYAWLARLPRPGSAPRAEAPLVEELRHTGDEALDQALDALEHAALRHAEHDGPPLSAALTRRRRELLEAERARSTSRLPPLNG